MIYAKIQIGSITGLNLLIIKIGFFAAKNVGKLLHRKIHIPMEVLENQKIKIDKDY